MPELQQRVVEIVRRSPLAVLSTVDENGNPSARYVMANISEDLTIRFATFAGSRKVAHIRARPDIHLICGVASLHAAADWIQVAGTAEVLTTEAVRHGYWHDGLRAYFQGPDDPRYAVVVITPKVIERHARENSQPEVWRA